LLTARRKNCRFTALTFEVGRDEVITAALAGQGQMLVRPREAKSV
jgi:hypothetical protein